jgi:hypothetical protein
MINSFELIEEYTDKRRFEYILSMSYEEFKKIINDRHKYENNYKKK